VLVSQRCLRDTTVRCSSKVRDSLPSAYRYLQAAFSIQRSS
jgi:hypothetical protein